MQRGLCLRTACTCYQQSVESGNRRWPWGDLLGLWLRSQQDGRPHTMLLSCNERRAAKTPMGTRTTKETIKSTKRGTHTQGNRVNRALSVFNVRK